MPTHCSAVELFGGPFDGERRVVPDNEDMIRAHCENDRHEPLVYNYVRSPDEFAVFVLVPEVMRG